MGTAELAATDQAQAAEREWDQRAARVARRFLYTMAVPAVYSVLSVAGILPALPWAPLG